MANGLKELITKYESMLRIEDWKIIPYENLREFEVALVKTGNYIYGLKEMEQTYTFLETKKITLYGRYNALEMILRRKMMDSIKDVEKRKGLWIAIDTGLSPEHSSDVLLVYAAKYGKEQTRKDITKMLETYEEKIQPQILRLKKKLNEEKDTKIKKSLEETYENHVQITNSIVTRVLPNFLKVLEKPKEMHKSEAMQL